MSDAAATAGRTEFTFDSADGRSQVRAVLWVPLSMERADAAFGEPELGCFKPRGVVQLIHGMAEHIDRYDDFARFLADTGYLVAGHDHIGHGDTAGAPERRGVIDAEGGADAMIEDARTPFDWLSRDPAVADAFMADEACGFMFGAGAYATLTELAHRANDPATYRDTPHDLPLLFVSGDADPVGKCGRAVADAAESMEAAGAEDLTLRLFPGMRHEILNEIGREEVYGFILEWINCRLA